MHKVEQDFELFCKKQYRSGMNINPLRLLVLVAEHRNISKAARAMSISSSLASRQIAALERRFGTRLIARTTRVLHLTAAGQTLAEWARNTLYGLSLVEDEIAIMKGEPKGVVRIASNEYMVGYRLPPIVTRFSERYPEIRIELTVTDDPFRLLDTHDFVIHAGLRPEQNLICQKIFNYRRGLCASPGYLDRFGTPKHPDELSGHRLVVHSDENDLWMFRRGKEILRHRVKAHTRANSYVGLFELAENGAGITRLSLPLVRRGTDRGSLVELLSDFEVTYPGGSAPAVWFAYPERQILHRAKLAVDFIGHGLLEEARQ
jgi:LysR family transcriptional regulator, transcriptional activator for dmlA